MGRRALLLLIGILLFSFKLFAATFVVTSNADSGPGTLREALTLAAANGSAVKDYINFNLPDLSEAGRTIAIKIDFPKITSDVVIDASTQPGLPLSTNGAKIIIKGENEKALLVYCFIVGDVADFEVYGLIVKNLYVADNQTFGAFGGIVIGVQGRVAHMIIGAPGKGNVFYNVQATIEGLDKDTAPGGSPPSRVEQIEIKSNLIGIAEDGIKIGEYKQSYIYLPYTYNTTIGGDTKEEGNTIFDLVGITPAGRNEDLEEDVHVKVKNNVFSANTAQQRTGDPNLDFNTAQQLSIGVQPLLTYHKNTTIDVTDNVFGYTLSITGFTNLSCNIQRNFFGTSADQLNKIPVDGSAIAFSYTSGKTLIGGSDNSEGNIIANCLQSKEALDYSYAAIRSASLDQAVKSFVELSHNSFYCNNGIPYSTYTKTQDPLIVTVDDLTPTSVRGKTKPNARVELFYTDKECTQCQPKTYLTTTYADANGNWVYNAALLAGYGVMAGATLNAYSSQFTDTRIYTELNPTFIQPECDKGGSILNIFSAINTKKLTWLNEAGQTVGDKIDLINVPAGKYRLKAEQFGCTIYSIYVVLEDDSPYLDDANKVVTQLSCGKPGSIKGLYTAYAVKFKWVDAVGNQVGDKLDVDNLPEGSYTLHYTGPRGCEKTYGPVILKNTGGPIINDTKPVITNTNCGESTGSIKNIVVTGGSGTRHYSWKNTQQNEVSTTLDLIGQPAGKYTLQVTDDTQCGPLFSKEMTILEENTITLNEPANPVTNTSCNKSNGSITGITATGATKYEWYTNGNKLVGTTADLKGMPAGTYQLVALNAFCNQTSKLYTITELPGTVFPANYNIAHIDACYGVANGGLQVNLDVLIKGVRWINAAGNEVGMHNGVTNLPAGSYKLYLTDQNGCESYYNTYQVASLSEYKTTNTGQASSETCGLKNGAVSATTVTGGLPPYKYKWLDANGTEKGSANSITGLAAGTYTLNITDSRCGEINLPYQIQNLTDDLPAPSLSDIQICTPGETLLLVNNPALGGVYRLYDQANSAAPIAEATGGRFKLNIPGNTSYYISQVNGSCESTRIKLNVTVGLSTMNIANTFTPNGDGHNDYWKIDGVENSPQATVQVFNRNGQKLFESKGYTQPFNGTYNGKALPAGTYFYIINLGKNCSLLSGSLTILR
jgi:gliding motility-associated-like protein